MASTAKRQQHLLFRLWPPSASQQSYGQHGRMRCAVGYAVPYAPKTVFSKSRLAGLQLLIQMGIDNVCPAASQIAYQNRVIQQVVKGLGSPRFAVLPPTSSWGPSVRLG